MSTVLFLIHIPSDETVDDDDEIQKETKSGDDIVIPVDGSSESSFNKKQEIDLPIVVIADENTDANEAVEMQKLKKRMTADSPKTLQKGFQRKVSYRFKKGVTSILKNKGIKKVSWSMTEDNLWKIMFPLDSNQSDDLLRQLLDAGIGNNNYSSVSILPITVNFPDMLIHQDADVASSSTEPSEKSHFIQSVKSRLTVVQVIDVVRSGSQLTFDYIMLIMMASLIAAVGLVEDSSVLLVASMLVSPLMGPILGGTFGIVLRYKPLWKTGIINELIGLALCLLAGFIFGLVCGLAVPEWSTVTAEMSSRGATRSLYVGVVVAVPSGAGVALSILGGNSGSLVGVAISASLLPPAVNAGICWAYALICAASDQSPASFHGNLTEGSLYDFHPSTLAKMGAVSMTLTLVNIVIIFIMGVLILKVKEVAPHTGTAVTRAFWKEDLRSTREHLRGRKSLDIHNIGDEVWEEWGLMNNLDLKSKETMKGDKAVLVAHQLKMALENIEMTDEYNGVIRNLPGKASGRRLGPLMNNIDSSSRFNVSKVYLPTMTTFHSNSRFLINKLSEEPALPKTDSFVNLKCNDEVAGNALIKRAHKISSTKKPLLNDSTEVS